MLNKQFLNGQKENKYGSEEIISKYVYLEPLK